MGTIDDLKKMSQFMRLRILDLAYKAGKNGSHVGGGLSSVEIFTMIYGSILKYNVSDPCNPSRDRFIVSKGHCANALYVALEHVGFLTKAEVDTFELNGSHFYAHAARDISKGIEFSGGSLSLGISYAVGVALSCKRAGLNNHIYVLLGDGECDEGLVWEASMAAAHYNLNNLTVIVDRNGFQSDGFTLDVMNKASLADKFASFGFHAQDVDGHNLEQLMKSFEMCNPEKPNAIIANTIKGKGVSFMENNREWHHNILSQNQYELAVAEQHDRNK